MRSCFCLAWRFSSSSVSSGAPVSLALPEVTSEVCAESVTDFDFGSVGSLFYDLFKYI